MLSRRRLAVSAAISQVPQVGWLIGPEYGLIGLGGGFVIAWSALITLQEGGETDGR